jgi:hypothetical protein
MGGNYDISPFLVCDDPTCLLVFNVKEHQTEFRTQIDTLSNMSDLILAVVTRFAIELFIKFECINISKWLTKLQCELKC